MARHADKPKGKTICRKIPIDDLTRLRSTRWFSHLLRSILSRGSPLPCAG